MNKARKYSRWQVQEMGRQLVRAILDEESLPTSKVVEASVHRPARSRIWQAVFTSPTRGQMWRSTGLTNRTQALLVAKRWEAEARAERAKTRLKTVKPLLRIRHSDPGTMVGFTQKEVAQILGISERAVREIEKRAIRKLLNHPRLRQIWNDYLAGTLDENEMELSPNEIRALFALVRNREEYELIQKALRLMQGFGE